MTPEQLVLIADLRERCRSGAARALRIGADLSLGNVSIATGNGVSTLWRWETGSRRPGATEAALRYAELLDALAKRHEPKRRHVKGGGARSEETLGSAGSAFERRATRP